MDVEHPGLNLTRNMMAASQIAATIRASLSERRVKRLREYRIVVDYAVMPDEPNDMRIYSFCLRVFRHGSKISLLTVYSETKDGLVSDENMALLLVLYNS